jgi:hypothetical protein
MLPHKTKVQDGKRLHRYWASTKTCGKCVLKVQCTSGASRRIYRWEHEAVLEAAQARLDRNPEALRIRRSTVEHPFGTIKAWMGSTHFLTKRLEGVNTEMSLHVVAYILRRVINLVGTNQLIRAIQA